MRVLLISANTEQINMPVLPMGLACLAEATKRAGHEVELLNLMAAQGSGSALREALNRFSPELIGISVRNIDDQSMTETRFLLDSAKDVVNECRNFTSVPIVLGGAGYSIFPRSVLAYLNADMGIRGEGESSFVDLLKRIRSRHDFSKIPGLVLREAGNSEKMQPIRNLDAYEIPPPHLLGCSGNSEEIWVPFQTRRGCPMECSYCSTAAIEGKIIRKRTPKLAVESMIRYVEAGFDRFFFVDNTFNLPPSYARELCEEITAAKLNISWRAILYPWKISEKLIELMAKAGCKEVSLGFESGSKKILQAMNKRFEPEEVGRISGLLKKYGIHSMGFLLLGGPGETKETVEESFDFADSLDLESLKVTVGIRIYPHTLLARIARSEGIISREDNLLFPRFYVNRQREEWIGETVHNRMKKRPHWHI